MAERLARIEQKLDKLLQFRLREDVPPPWFRTSEERLLSAIADVAKSCTQVVTSRDLLRHDLEKLAEGADRFLAGIKAELTKAQGDLFFEMIATVQEGCVRRVQSYGDIGAKLGITKQAIQKRYKKLCEAHPSVAAYIDSIRNPQKSSNFSEISPKERRKRGVDDSYGYDAH
jgi:hypothetical protein